MPNKHQKNQAPAASLLPWLVYEQSLTQKLEAITGDARLQVLNQDWELPDAWDQSILKLNNKQVLHRQIIMWAYDLPCWYARTIIPDTTWQSGTTLFERLKTESLGHLIFNGNEIQRVSLKHYLITPSSSEYHWLSESWHTGASELWVRLAEFVVYGKEPFFLIEILLPGLLRYLS